MIYYVRHGQTDFNLFKITQGQIDTSLNRTGLAQAQKLAEELKDYKFDNVYCSPLIRTRQTLEAIMKYHPETIPITFDDRLKEIGKGVLEGGKNSLDVYADFYAHPEKYGGETSEEVYNRINEFVCDMQQDAVGNTLIVAHHGIFKYFPFCLTQKDIHKDEVTPYRVHNCEVVNLTELVAQESVTDEENQSEFAQILDSLVRPTEDSLVGAEQLGEGEHPQEILEGTQDFAKIVYNITGDSTVNKLQSDSNQDVSQMQDFGFGQ